METFIIDGLYVLEVALFVAPVAVGVMAHRRGRSALVVLALAIICAAGVAVCFIGLLGILFNGHIEDFGSRPARTLGRSIPLTVFGAVLAFGSGLVAWRRRDQRASRLR